jgi:hypothetical protein
LGRIFRYYESLGSAPHMNDVPRSTLDRFGRYAEPFHYVMDVDLRHKDGDFSKFSVVRFSAKQPTNRDPENRDITIAGHFFKPLADEMAQRLGLIALSHRPVCQKAELAVGGRLWNYDCLSVPLFDHDGFCDRALVVFDSDHDYVV